MFTKRRVVADADHFALKWAPVLLRFFQLFVSDQSMAEKLTLDTLAEHVRTSGTSIDDRTVVLLFRRALVKGRAAPTTPVPADDHLLRALRHLERDARAAVVLSRGLSFGMEATAEVLGLRSSQARRLFAHALYELHLLLSRCEIHDFEKSLPTQVARNS